MGAVSIGGSKMTMYRVMTNNGEDWGTSHFHVFADSIKGAWREALKLEYRENIEQIYPVMYIG